MRVLIIIIGLLFTTPAWASNYNIFLQYEPDLSWLDDGSASWLNLDIDGTVAPRRIAVAFQSGGVEIARVWDDPANRTLPFAISFDMPGPRAKITGHTYAYEGGPWRAATAYALGDKISVGAVDAGTGLESIPSPYHWWQCNRSGTSGSARPSFATAQKKLRSDFYALAESGNRNIVSVADNGGGTISFDTSLDHTFVAGDVVRVSGTTNYDGVHTLPDQTGGDSTHVIITATYVAETFAMPYPHIWLTSAEAVDLGSGLVSIPAPAHDLVAGDVVAIWGTQYYGYSSIPLTGSAVDLGSGRVAINTTVAHVLVAGEAVKITTTTNYNGVYILPDQTGGDTDTFVINATYVAETMAGFVQEMYVLPSQALGDADHVVISSAFQPDGFEALDKFVVVSGRTVDNGDGTVTLSVPGHGYVAGDVVSINGTLFDGAQALPSQTLGDADHLVITATWADVYHAGAESVTPAIDDPDGSGAQWVWMTGDTLTAQTVLSAEPTGRIIVRQPTSGNVVKRSGTNFIIGHGP